MKKEPKGPVRGRVSDGNRQAPQGSEAHASRKGEYVVARTSEPSPEATAVQQHTRQGGGNVPVVGEAHSQKKAGAKGINMDRRWK